MKLLYDAKEGGLEVMTDDGQGRIDLGALKSAGTELGMKETDFKFKFVNGVEITAPKNVVRFK